MHNFVQIFQDLQPADHKCKDCATKVLGCTYCFEMKKHSSSLDMLVNGTCGFVSQRIPSNFRDAQEAAKKKEFVVQPNAQEGDGLLFFAEELVTATTHPGTLKLLIAPQVADLHQQSFSSRMVLHLTSL
jgi:hypothetical protein